MHATSRSVYGPGSIAIVPPTVRASVPWGPEIYSPGKRPGRTRKPAEPLAEVPTGQGAETRARMAGQDVPLSPRERSRIRQATAEHRYGERPDRIIVMGDLD